MLKKDQLKVIKYFDTLFNNIEIDQIDETRSFKEIKSIREYAKYFGLPFITFRRFLIIYLNEKFGNKNANIIYQKLWPSLQEKTKVNKKNFLKKLSHQLENYYPNDIEKIYQRIDYAQEFSVDPNTITNWIMEYLKNIYFSFLKIDEAREQVQKIYNEIWTINLRISGGRQVIDYDRIKKHVKSKQGELITKKEEFEEMEEIISKRYVLIECQENHTCPVTVTSLLYRKSWCPYCYQLKCQEYLLMFMEAIFGTKFSSISLSKAYGLKYRPGEGMLKFDGYNESVVINNRVFKVACEFDGRQHDEYPNYYHNSLEEYEYARKNDKRKNKHAKDHKTILIRIKEIYGFNKKCFEENPNEVIKEIIKQFNEQVQDLYEIYDIRLKYKQNKDYLNVNDVKNKKGSLDKYI